MSAATAGAGRTKPGAAWEMQEDEDDAWGFDDMDEEIGSDPEKEDAEAAWGFDDEEMDSAWGFDEESKTPSPTKATAPSPTKQRAPSPTKQRAPSPTKRRAPSPVKQRAPSPVKQRAPSPVKQRAPSPVKQRAPSPVKPRAPSPTKQKAPSPIKQKAPSPVKQKAPSPIKPTTSPAKQSGPTTVKQSVPSAVKQTGPSATKQKLLGATKQTDPTPIKPPTTSPTKVKASSPTKPSAPSPSKQSTTGPVKAKVSSPTKPKAPSPTEFKAIHPTNSFPPVPPAKKAAVQPPPVPLPHSQAELIVEEEEKADLHKGFEDKESESQDLWGEEGASAWDDGEIGFGDEQPLPGSEGPAEPTDEEARFEEGLPLVSPNRVAKTQDEVTEALPVTGLDQKKTSSDFFDQSEAVNDAETDETFPSINRKSTEQVLSSVQPALRTEPPSIPEQPQTVTDVENSINNDPALANEQTRGDDDLAAWGVADEETDVDGVDLWTAKAEEQARMGDTVPPVSSARNFTETVDQGLTADNRLGGTTDLQYGYPADSAISKEDGFASKSLAEFSDTADLKDFEDDLPQPSQASEAQSELPQELSTAAQAQPESAPRSEPIQFDDVEEPKASEDLFDMAGQDVPTYFPPSEPVPPPGGSSTLETSANLVREDDVQHPTAPDQTMDDTMGSAFNQGPFKEQEDESFFDHPMDAAETSDMNQFLSGQPDSAAHAPSTEDTFHYSWGADATSTGNEDRAVFSQPEIAPAEASKHQEPERTDNFFDDGIPSSRADELRDDGLLADHDFAQQAPSLDVPELEEPEPWTPEPTDLTAEAPEMPINEPWTPEPNKPAVAAPPKPAVNETVTSFSAQSREQTVEDDFFTNLGGDSAGDGQQTEAATIGSKSVEQESTIVEQFAELRRPDSLDTAKSSDLADMTGGGLAVSTTTVVSQVLQESLAAKESPGLSQEAPVKREDLSALWDAAIGDEELLEEESTVDPSAFFDDDGEGFLDEAGDGATFSPPAPTPVRDSFGQLQGFDSLSKSASRPSSQHQPSQKAQTSKYAPVAAPGPAPKPAQASTAPGQSQYAPYARAAPVQPAAGVGAAATPLSFANQTKGGYSSPFDAPMDLSRPKRMPSRQAMNQQPQLQTAVPPPRSSSISATSPPSNRPPSSSGYPPSTQAPRPPSSGASAFFEELPIAPKVRPPSTTGRMTAPPQSGPPQAAPSQAMPPPRRYDAPPSSPPKAGPPPPASYGLVAPERKMSFEEAPQQFAQPPAAAAPSKTAPPSNRYSPAPATLQQGPSAPNRYAPPPSGGAPPRPPSVSSVQYQPRTSSPLAQHSTAYQPDPTGAQSRGPPSGPPRQYSISEVLDNDQPMPQAHLAPGVDPNSIERPNVKQRGLIQNQSSGGQYAPTQAQAPAQQPRRVGGPPDDAHFIPPTDERQHDPLKRWQGSPIFQFGFGGSVVTSFPKRMPRFVTGQKVPSVICAAGDVKVHGSKLLPIDELVTSFPGPLKGKGKKKDVLAWLDRGVQQLETNLSQGNVPPALLSPPNRYEERILLWRILRALVEFDGNIETNPAAVTALRHLLSPELKPSESASGLYGGSYQPRGIIAKAQGSQKPAGGSDVVEQIRKLLLEGDREKAVWHAVDQRLWGHAMLIASTLSKDIWKQVAQEFVRNDVKTVGDNVEPLAALYDIFAGNSEESVDELVSSSARAGLQMMNKTAASGPAKNAFEGLNHWRETLSLVLGNRSADDVKALASLGHLLSTYGRNEAAHICYMFARLPGLIGGAEEPQAAIVLLGENHRQQPMGYAQNLSSVLLTEVYEFATCVLATPAASPLGHLQSFKFWHATMLADSGQSDQAQQYCDAINAALKGSTKASPYYHAQLFAAVDDLASRLQSAPRDSSGKWMTRPNMDKVSGSVWNRFTQFVAGDESDTASTASKAEVEGPFARISGTPNISRGPSPVDHSQGALNGYAASTPTAPVPPPVTNSRYAPKGAYAPQPAGVKKQPSYASMPSSSPVSQGPLSAGYQAPPRTMPAPAAGGASRYSPATAPKSSPEARFQSPPSLGLPPRQEPSEPSHSPSHSGISDAEVSPVPPPSMSISQPAPPTERKASPYEPRPAATTTRASNYAPRPQASPAEVKQQPPETTQPIASFEPPASMPDAYPSSPPTYPAAPEISQMPPTPQEAVHETTQNNSYQPPNISQPETANAGTVPEEPAQPEPEEPEEPAYEPPLSMAEIRARNKKQNSRPPTRDYEPSSGGHEPPSGGYEPPGDGYQPPSVGYQPPSAGYEPPGDGYQPPSAGYQPPSAGYQPPSAGYQPPNAGYQPPSAGYQPPSAGYEPPSAHFGSPTKPTANGDAPESPPAKKKGMMDLSDDEDDLAARAASLKKGQRSEADRQADDAFRKAAEADAARDKAPEKTLKPKSSGWLGGWFTRGKEQDMGDPNGPKKAIKARLGEENSFVFDPQLKKWVNKNAKPEDQAAAAAPTPPPPKGPPSFRGASPMPGAGPPMGGPPMGGPPMGGPPMGGSNPASRTASPAVGGHTPPPGGAPPGGPPAMIGGEHGVPAGLAPGVAPPSRPNTSQSGLSNASSIDDLIGAPAARKGGTMKGKKKGRGYVDVMAK